MTAAESLRIHEAFEAGDLAALRRALGPELPNCTVPPTRVHCLEYAIYHAPLSLVRSLLELGADLDYASAGFPSLIAALSSKRRDRAELLALLLDAGADVEQRGLNDWTPLHYAAAQDDPAAIELLLAHGADPGARTRIDDQTTPLEEAERLGRAAAAAALRSASRR